MKIRPSQYAQALYELAVENPKEIKEICQIFFDFLKRQHQLKFLPEILKELDYYDQKVTGKVKLDVITARPLTKEGLQELIDNLEKILKIKINPQLKISPDLVGGFKVLGRDILIDGSISGILNSLKSCQKY